MIPSISQEGLLPPGRHSATLDEVKEIFVERAPFSDERRIIFSALDLHLTLMKQIFRSGAAWINGGFVTHKSWAPPKDADIAYVLSSAAVNALDAESAARLGTLLTLQGVVSFKPSFQATRVQPMGGLLDSFLVVEEQSDQVATWDSLWCTVMGEDSLPVDGATKGYVEVVW